MLYSCATQIYINESRGRLAKIGTSNYARKHFAISAGSVSNFLVIFHGIASQEFRRDIAIACHDLDVCERSNLMQRYLRVKDFDRKLDSSNSVFLWLQLKLSSFQFISRILVFSRCSDLQTATEVFTSRVRGSLLLFINFLRRQLKRLWQFALPTAYVYFKRSKIYFNLPSWKRLSISFRQSESVHRHHIKNQDLCIISNNLRHEAEKNDAIIQFRSIVVFNSNLRWNYGFHSAVETHGKKVSSCITEIELDHTSSRQVQHSFSSFLGCRPEVVAVLKHNSRLCGWLSKLSYSSGFTSATNERKQFNRRSPILVIRERSKAEYPSRLQNSWDCVDASIDVILMNPFIEVFRVFARNLQSNVVIAGLFATVTQLSCGERFQRESRAKSKRNVYFLSHWKCFSRRCLRDESRKSLFWPLSFMWIGVKMYLSQRRRFVVYASMM